MPGPPAPDNVAFELRTSSYREELDRLCTQLEGPVCQIGARAHIIDTKVLSWRERLKYKGFIGADIGAGPNVDVVFDICAPLPEIEAALAPVLRTGPLKGLICAHLLEHLRRPWEAARNMTELLAPEGLVFVQVPWVQAFHPFPDDFWRFSLSGLLELFSGLELVDSFYSGGSSDVAHRVIRSGNPDRSIQARQIEAQAFQVLLSSEVNRRLLGSLPEPRAYLSRGYMPVTVINFVARKPTHGP